MSVEVPVDRLESELERWGFCYLLTVSDDLRPHLLALRPAVVESGGVSRLRFDVGGGRAGRNAAARPEVTLVLPPVDGSGGMSLVVDGVATAGDGVVDVTPTSAILHRAAPDLV